MTVRQLYYALQDLSPDALILIPAYEAGWDECREPVKVEVVKEADHPSIFGSYRTPASRTDGPLILAYCLGDARL